MYITRTAPTGRRFVNCPGASSPDAPAAEVIESAEEAVVLYLTGNGATEGSVGVELAGFDLRIETDKSVKSSGDVSTSER
jgi:hypothetical protein